MRYILLDFLNVRAVRGSFWVRADHTPLERRCLWDRRDRGRCGLRLTNGVSDGISDAFPDPRAIRAGGFCGLRPQ
jgi:hypothetical protein